METKSNSESLNKRGVTVDPKVAPFVPKTDHNPRDLRSWAKRTGFVSDYSGEAGTSGSEKFEPIDPVIVRTRHNNNNKGIEIQPVSHGGTVLDENVRKENEPVFALNPDGERKVGYRGNVNGNGSNGHGVSAVTPVPEENKNLVEGEVKVNLYEEGVEPVDGGGWKGPSELKCGLKENPGFG